jgi:hypothetical protein
MFETFVKPRQAKKSQANATITVSDQIIPDVYLCMYILYQDCDCYFGKSQ